MEHAWDPGLHKARAKKMTAHCSHTKRDLRESVVRDLEVCRSTEPGEASGLAAGLAAPGFIWAGKLRLASKVVEKGCSA